MVEFHVLLPIWGITWHQSTKQGRAGRNFQQTQSQEALSQVFRSLPSKASQQPAPRTSHSEGPGTEQPEGVGLQLHTQGNQELGMHPTPSRPKGLPALDNLHVTCEVGTVLCPV